MVRRVEVQQGHRQARDFVATMLRHLMEDPQKDIRRTLALMERELDLMFA